jgi:hypothetical protein
MLFSASFVLIGLVSLPLQSVYGHGVITAVTGANGVNGAGFGVVASTPRDGSTPKPFEVSKRVLTYSAVIEHNSLDRSKIRALLGESGRLEIAQR